MNCDYCNGIQFENRQGLITCAMCGSVVLKEGMPTHNPNIPYLPKKLSDEDVYALEICNSLSL